ncbi:hypothetical protein MITSMUL_04829 [Mitsuokella multacida DSM 20544]|uniref:Uncharacterized protein n=1 Tax=Mitsuokella multacida DSM 20544 TaxID=500635 RepID=C9KN18_9FIRM|nr:hypothetical protein MITSMUL_04829 [Mitsuokella multacida DSM 20544]
MVLCQYTSFINDCNIILFIDEICNIYKTNRLHLTFSEKPCENRKFSVNSNPHYLNVSVTLHWTENQENYLCILCRFYRNEKNPSRNP